MTDANEFILNDSGFDVVILPPQYSDVDQEYRKQLLEYLARLQDSYRKQAEPIIKRLADIDARYAPRAVIAPK